MGGPGYLFEGGAHVGGKVLDGRFGDLVDQVFLARYVVVEGSLLDAHGVGDLADGCGEVALAREQGAGGVQHARVGFVHGKLTGRGDGCGEKRETTAGVAQAVAALIVGGCRALKEDGIEESVQFRDAETFSWPVPEGRPVERAQQWREDIIV